MIITIDGPAGSGKSTVADLLAKKLKFIHFNSGSLYRGITAHLINIGANFNNLGALDFHSLKLETKFIKGIQHVYVNNIDYTSQLRDNEVSVNSPIVSNIQSLRNIIDKCQREFASKHDIVVDGRDTGSFVFPNAEYKFYLECSLKERARRRYKEEKTKNPKIKLKDIEEQINARDIFDKTKEVAKLVVPEGAIIIDSSKLSVEEVVNAMLKYVIK